METPAPRYGTGNDQTHLEIPAHRYGTGNNPNPFGNTSSSAAVLVMVSPSWKHHYGTVTVLVMINPIWQNRLIVCSTGNGQIHLG